MYLKKGGSSLSADQPFLRTESNFNKVMKMHKLLKVIYSPDHQKKWDKVLEDSQVQPLGESTRNIGYSYTKNKKQFTIASRDFFEKGFNFYHDGKFYRYSTSVPDSENSLKPLVDKKTVRGTTNFNVGIMERDPGSGKILFTMAAQCDFKIKVPSFMLTSFLPSAVKSWHENVSKYYNKNHKQI